MRRFTTQQKALLLLLAAIFQFKLGISQIGQGPAPYCMDTYWNIPCNQPNASNTPGNWVNDFINSFNTTGAVQNIVNNNSGCNSQVLANVQQNYMKWPCPMHLVVNPGQVITCNFQSGITYAQGFAVFVDWNQDGIFQIPAERVCATPGVPPAATWASAAFTVPPAQPNGLYRMRVRCVYFMNGVNIVPCTTESFGETEDYNLYVGPPPPAVISATATSNSPLCVGQNLNLTVAHNSSIVPTFTWTGPNNFSSFVQSPVIPNVSTAAAGVYTVIINNGCATATVMTTVVVNPPPVIQALSNSPVCIGSPITFTGTGANTYTWTGPNSFFTTGPNPTISNAQTFHAGNYTLVATAANGCTSSVITNVVVNSPPVINPNSNSPVCAGAPINLSVGPAISYTWTGPNAFTSNLQNPTIPVSSTLNAGPYTVSVTATNGCKTSATINVVVNPNPPISPSNGGPYCVGQTINLSAPAAVSYTWTGPNGFTSNLQNPFINNAQLVNAGNYVVSVTTAGGCISSGTTNVVVNAAPAPSANSNAPVCQGQQLSLSGSAAASYTWTGPNGFSSNLQNPFINPVTMAAAGNYTFAVTSVAGCVGSVVINVVINPLPVVTVNSPTVCVGNNFTLTSTGGGSYSWTGPVGFTSTQQNPVLFNASTPMSGNYNVLVTSPQGCTNSAVASVSVITLPVITVVGTNTFCSQNFNGSPSTVNLTASGGSSYVWNLPPGFNVTPNNMTNPVTLSGPVTAIQSVASVTVVGTLGSCSNSAVYNVTVVPNPTIVPSPATASICQGNSINLSVSGANSYTWSPATGLNTTNGPNVVANPNNTTVYSIIGSSSGCNSQTQNITLNVVPNPTPVVNPSNPLICLGSSINLTAAGASTYTWSPNIAINTTLGPNVTVNPSSNQTYVVTAQQAGCTGTVAVTVTVLPLPNVIVTPSSPTMCLNNFNGSPNSITLNATGAVNYNWGPVVGMSLGAFTGSSVVGTSDGSSMVATGTVVGTIGTCTNAATFTINAVANPVITVNSGSICSGSSIQLIANGATTYSWSPAFSLSSPTGPSVFASPAVTTVYNVIGSSAGCNSQTQNATVTVIPNPALTINPGNPIICLGSQITLTAGGATNYTWSPNVAISSTSGPVVTVNPTSNQTYILTGEQAACTSTAAVTVTVLPLPVANVALSSPTLCANNFNGSPNSVVLTASGGTSYNWLPPVGLNLNTFSGSSVTATSNGAPVGTGTVIVSNGSCTNSATYTVNAVTNPVVSVTSGSMCAGTSINLTASGANTYIWSPAASLSSSTGPNVTASPAVTTVYNVIGSSAGCNSQTQSATVNVVPNPVVSIAPASPSICAGSSINLNAVGATNYTWTPNLSISSTNGPFVTVNPPSTLSYSVVGEQAACTGTAMVTVTVVPLPVVTVAINTSTICENNFNGSPISVTAFAGGANSYVWTGFSGLSPQTTVGSMITALAQPPASMGFGTVIGSISTCTSSATFSVIIVPNPVVSVTSGTICSGKSITLNATGANTYTWSPASSLDTGNGPIVVASPTINTVYSIIGSSLNCQSATQTATVLVLDNPILTVTPFTPTVCAGSPIGLIASGAVSYSWSPGISLNTTFGHAVVASPSVTTNYTVIGMGANSCTTAAVRQVIAIPLPEYQIDMTKPAICRGDKTTININGATSYTWEPKTGLDNPNTNFVNAGPLQTTNYTVTGSNGLCQSTTVIPLVVVDKPVMNLTASPTKVCLGSNASIFASGAQGYNWYPSTGNFTIAANNVAIVSPTASTNYTITGYNSQGTVTCSMTQEILVEVVQPIQASISPSMSICKGESVKLVAGGSNTYRWSPEDGLDNPNSQTPYASPISTTIYTVTVSEGGFCKVTTTVLVHVKPQPTVDAGPDMTYNQDDLIYLNAKGSGVLTWISGEGIVCRDCPNTQIIPLNSGCYRVLATDNQGCKAEDEVCIEITKNFGIYIPNTFTPNDDGLNDVFMVYGSGISDVEINIFDRWGEKLFTSTEQTRGWDGTYNNEYCKNDVYVYQIKYTSLDGKKHTKTGHVTLMK